MMQLINNYLDSFERYLPEDIRTDIRQEFEASLFAQVEDKQEQLKRALTDEEQEAILQSLGHPMKVASGFLPKQNLIGKNYFPLYKKALEISLVLGFVFVLLTSLPALLASKGLVATLITFALQVTNTSLYVIGIVTFVFYLMDYYDADINFLYGFSASDLASSSAKLSLSRLESGFELVVYTLFLGWWNNLLPWPFFDEFLIESLQLTLSQEWLSVHLAVTLLVSASLALSAYNFTFARWNTLTLIGDIGLSLASLVVLYQISQFERFYNYNTTVDIPEHLQKFVSNLDITVYSSLAIIAGICLWGIYENSRKLIRR